MSEISISPVISTALEASHVIKPGRGILRALAGRLDSTAPAGTYYVQVLNAGSLPPDGAVTHLLPPGKIVHAAGVDEEFDFTGDIPTGGVAASDGVVVALSTTEFTKTIAGPYLSVGGG